LKKIIKENSLSWVWTRNFQYFSNSPYYIYTYYILLISSRFRGNTVVHIHRRNLKLPCFARFRIFNLKCPKSQALNDFLQTNPNNTLWVVFGLKRHIGFSTNLGIQGGPRLWLLHTNRYWKQMNMQGKMVIIPISVQNRKLPSYSSENLR
jgi:hypothetical protein